MFRLWHNYFDQDKPRRKTTSSTTVDRKIKMVDRIFCNLKTSLFYISNNHIITSSVIMEMKEGTLFSSSHAYWCRILCVRISALTTPFSLKDDNLSLTSLLNIFIAWIGTGSHSPVIFF